MKEVLKYHKMSLKDFKLLSEREKELLIIEYLNSFWLTF